LDLPGPSPLPRYYVVFCDDHDDSDRIDDLVAILEATPAVVVGDQPISWPGGIIATIEQGEGDADARLDLIEAWTVAGVPSVDGDVDAGDLARALTPFLDAEPLFFDLTGLGPTYALDLSAVPDAVKSVTVYCDTAIALTITPPVRPDRLGLMVFVDGGAAISVSVVGGAVSLTGTSVLFAYLEPLPSALGAGMQLGPHRDPVVASVNGQTGVVVLDADDIGDGTTNKAYTATEKTKLAGIATGATANQSDATTNAAIALKADLASPALTGNPTAPTQTAGNNSTRLATTAYVETAAAAHYLPFVTGAYYSLSGGETSGTVSALNPAGELQAHPVYLQAGNYDRIAMYVATAAVSTYRLGVYPNNAATYKPDGQTLILDAGTLNMNAGTGIQQITVTLTIPTSGIYWLAVLCDAYTAKPSIVGWAGNSGVVPNVPYFGSIVFGSVAGRSPFACYATGVTTGAMPATFPTSTKNDICPQITVRKA